MRYPKLITKSYCKTPIKVTIYTGEIGEDGEPLTYGTLETTCNYQASAMRKFGDFHQDTTITSSVYFSDDIFPELSVITSGVVEVFGETRDIVIGEKARNPDGTVNFVRLGLK